jgi:hypothetical protein
MWLDTVESFIANASEWSKLHRNALHGGIGLAILFYGSSFSNLVLFGHSLAVAGLPILRQHGKELISSYTRTRAAIKAQAPLLLEEGTDSCTGTIYRYGIYIHTTYLSMSVYTI